MKMWKGPKNVTWDMTNIGCFGFSDANMQRLISANIAARTVSRAVCFVNCLVG
jgi:predicted transport protein